MDVNPVMGVLAGEDFRIGVGFNQGLRRAPRGFIGWNIGAQSDESHVGGLSGELEIPAAGPLDFILAAAWRPSKQYFDGGLRVGARHHIGRKGGPRRE